MSYIEPLELTKKFIRCPSVTPLDAGVMDVLAQALSGLGFEIHRVRFEELDHDPVDNMFAKIGTAAPLFCFAGHLDVVPAGDASAWIYPPFEPTVKDGVLYGRGAEDMKAAIACFISAVSKFIEQPFNGSIGLIITCDEEGIAINGTKKLLEWMKGQGHVPDACIVGEPTNPETLGQMMKIGRRGSINCTLTALGKQGHVAYPHLAKNPNTMLVNMLHHLQSSKLDDGNEFFPPSNLEITSIDVGNPTTNLIPEQAKAHFNIRFNNIYSGKTIVQWIRARLDEVGGEYELSLRVSGESFLTPPGHLSDVVGKAVHKVTGRTPELSTTGGTSDARFIKDYCPVVEFGITGRTPHKVNECVKVDDIYTLSDIYLEVLKGYFGK
jgi:succinyl-diaminopimelate desuccinylase